MPEPDEDEEELEDEEDDVAPVGAVIAQPGQVEESFDELLSKHVEPNDDDDEESLMDLTREERLESLSIRAAPKQANEFVCSNCHLVKHNSQLANAKRELCRDCV
ncbi:MAG: DUF4193 family protein [Actinomycetota bacterium]|nr:DUF4193 family protein [Actinomycetota bacterium]